jgi:hypothetical protein
MILNGSVQELFEFEKKQSLKIDPGTKQKRGKM